MIKVSQNNIVRICKKCGAEHNFRFEDNKSGTNVPIEVCIDCFFDKWIYKDKIREEDHYDV